MQTTLSTVDNGAVESYAYYANKTKEDAIEKELANTHVNVEPATREVLVGHLNETLATVMDLYTQVKQAHWNVRGPWFFARHQLFDGLADHLRAYADQVAERVGTLGGAAHGTVRMAAANSTLPEYEAGRADGMAHIRRLANRYGTLTEQLRSGIDKCASAGEPATEDLLIEGLRTFELDLWFLESHAANPFHAERKAGREVAVAK